MDDAFFIEIEAYPGRAPVAGRDYLALEQNIESIFFAPFAAQAQVVFTQTKCSRASAAPPKAVGPLSLNPGSPSASLSESSILWRV